MSDTRITADYFYNWAVIRKFALRFSVPSWVFIQSVGFEGLAVGLSKRRTPNEHEIFWQINVSLAYGAKGIQYFTYWTPSSPDVRFGNALITRDGQRTALYEYAKNANDYLRVVGKELLPLTSESVVHARVRRLPRGAQGFRADGYVRSVSGSPVILGRFRPDEGTDRYMLVVNRSFVKSANTQLTLSDSIGEVFKLDIETEAFVPVALQGTPPRNLPLKIEPGRAELYRLQIG